MKRIVGILVIVMVATLVDAHRAYGAVEDGVPTGTGDPGQVIEGEVTLQFDPTLATGEAIQPTVPLEEILELGGSALPAPVIRDAFALANGLEEIAAADGIGWVRYRITDQVPVPEKISLLTALPEVEAAVPNYLGEFAAFPSTAPNDPRYNDQWGTKKVNMLGAWQLAGGGSTTRMLAVVDTGVRGGMNASGVFESQHEDLGFIDGRNFTLPYVSGQPQRKKFNDDCNHGTRVAGIAGAFTNNGKGIAGVAYNAPIWSLRVDGTACSVDVTAAAFAIDWAVSNGAYGITASFAKYAPSDSQVAPLKAAVDRAWNYKVPVVAASGNGNLNGFQDYVPARWYNVISVGGTNSNNARCTWVAFDGLTDGANYGYPGLDLSAPCLSVLSTEDGGGYASVHGTSLAVPYVAGIIFIMKSKYPSWTSQQIKNELSLTADKVGGYNYSSNPYCGGHSPQLGCGLLDADSAVN